MITKNLSTAATFAPRSLQSPNAWVGHLPFAAWIINEISPKIFVELGTHTGNSYFSFCQSVVEHGLTTKCYAVDTWRGDEHAGQYDENIYAEVQQHNQTHYASFSRLLRMTFDDARSYFSDGSIALLHIDGLHTYEAVRHDFETWLPKLAAGAVVMFHDTNVRERDFGVWKLWEELQVRYPDNLEFFHSHGLGVLQLDGLPAVKRLEWLKPNSPDRQQLIDYFTALGLHQLERFELNEAKLLASNLYQSVSKCNEHIASLDEAIRERDSRIASMDEAVRERDRRIASLDESIDERDSHIASLDAGIAERNAHIDNLINSRSWLLTRPLRWTGRVLRGDLAAAIDPFKKLTGSHDRPASTQVEPPSPDDHGVFLVEAKPIDPENPVCVIVPVYRDVEMTRRCILAAMPDVLAIAEAMLLAINDASPDEGMQRMLEELSAQWPGKMTVLENPHNLGFVRTVNRGLACFPQHDVTLLNSDVVVPRNWLQRLIDEAYLNPKVGTVTPFSNNATICSFPYSMQENIQPFGLDVDAVDAVFGQHKLPCVAAPTGVGFCMYIRRACLDETGYLDEEKFGRGYGEENDLCQRALKRGWLNIISPNIYAYHVGGASFSSEKQALINRAMKVLDELHPNYHRDIQSFIMRDPLKSARIKRHVQLLSTVPVPKVLHISHNLGGGVSQHIEELEALLGDRLVHLLLTPHETKDKVQISIGISPHTNKFVFDLTNAYDEMLAFLRAVGVSAVHFHHTMGVSSRMLDLPCDLGVAYLVTVHDFYWLNANPTLTDENGKYPGFFSDSQRNPLFSLPPDLTPVSWREQFRPLIENAARTIFPSNATKSIFDGLYRPSNPVVAPHAALQLDTNRPPEKFVAKSRYVVGILGAIGREKGADLLEAIAVEANKNGAHLEFRLIGYAYRPLKLVKATGPYQTKSLVDLIRKQQFDIVFFPALWPETYSYTLSYALDSGLPIVAPNLGAFPERLSGRSNTMLFDHLSPADELLKKMQTFIENLSNGVPVTAPVFANDASNPDFYMRDYMQIVSRDLKVLERDKTVPFKFESAQIVSESADRQYTWRETLLRGLWHLYMKPSMRWVNGVIPYSVRRLIKRSLSRSALHDLIRHG